MLIAVWTLPITMMIAALVKIPLAPIVLIAFACRLLWRLSHEGRVAAPQTREAAAVRLIVRPLDSAGSFR